MIEIRQITARQGADANIPNEPFTLWGRMIPSLRDGVWDYRTEEFSKQTQMCFPDFSYDVSDSDAVFFGAYDGSSCIGVAVLRKAMFRNLYLEDLKVNKAYRGRGIGGRLIDACMEKAKAENMQGVYTVGQDNNLSACLFYLRHGFSIGGFDNRAYRGTQQEDKADIYFYRDISKN